MKYPEIATVEDYVQIFTDLDYWQPYIKHICTQHDLKCRTVRGAVPGSNIVFLVDDAYAVKIFSEFFGGVHSFQAERDIHAFITQHPDIPAPNLVASGALFPQSSPDERWHYPYLITQVIPGISLGEAPPGTLEDNGTSIASYTGALVRHLHDLPLDNGLSYLEPTWDQFTTFMDDRRRRCMANHREWGSLPGHLIEQLDNYLPSSVPIDTSQPPHLIHADITQDHLMGRVQAGVWQSTGIIDFGDAKIGDPFYEFVALHLDVFRCNKTLLDAFFDAYGGKPADFAYRAMTYTLLHEFNVLEVVDIPASVQTLQELAEHIWG